jgi:hypothetical protein
MSHTIAFIDATYTDVTATFVPFISLLESEYMPITRLARLKKSNLATSITNGI